MTKINTYIVEDDIENIGLLALLLKKCCSDTVIAGKATNTAEFIDLLLMNQPAAGPRSIKTIEADQNVSYSYLPLF